MTENAWPAMIICNSFEKLLPVYLVEKARRSLSRLLIRYNASGILYSYGSSDEIPLEELLVEDVQEKPSETKEEPDHPEDKGNAEKEKALISARRRQASRKANKALGVHSSCL